MRCAGAKRKGCSWSGVPKTLLQQSADKLHINKHIMSAPGGPRCCPTLIVQMFSTQGLFLDRTVNLEGMVDHVKECQMIMEEHIVGRYQVD